MRSMLAFAGTAALVAAACTGVGEGTANRSSSRASGDEADQHANGSSKPTSCVTTVAIKDTVGGSFVIPRDINEKGQVVGSAETGATVPDDTSIVHAFSWEAGVMVDLGTFGGAESDALDVNDLGEIVGYAAEQGHHSSNRAALWKNGQMIDLGTLGGDFSIAGHINNAGQIVGNSLTAEGQTHGFLYENGAMRDLGTLGGNFSAALSINDKGQIYGHSSVPNDTKRHVFLWENGAMKDLGPERPEDFNQKGDVLLSESPNVYLVSNGTRTRILPFEDSVFTGVRDMNDKAAIIGETKRSSGETFTFLWQDGKTTQIGLESEVVLIAINNDAQIAGHVGKGNDTRAISWKNGVITFLGKEGEKTLALKINDKGQIVGQWEGGAEGRVWEVKSCGGEAGKPDQPGSGKTW